MNENIDAFLTFSDLEDLASINPDGFLFANLLDKLMTRTCLSAPVILRQRELHMHGISRIKSAAERIQMINDLGDELLDSLLAQQRAANGRGE